MVQLHPRHILRPTFIHRSGKWKAIISKVISYRKFSSVTSVAHKLISYFKSIFLLIISDWILKPEMKKKTPNKKYDRLTSNRVSACPKINKWRSKVKFVKKKNFKIVFYIKILLMFRGYRVLRKLSNNVVLWKVSIEFLYREGSGQNINSPKAVLWVK